MDDLSRLLASEQIRQLVAGYALAMDSRDIDTLVGLYVDDVRVGRRSVGHDALRADFTKHLRGVGITILFVGNHVIDFVDSDHATGVVYCKGEIQDKERWISQAIQYFHRGCPLSLGIVELPTRGCPTGPGGTNLRLLGDLRSRSQTA